MGTKNLPVTWHPEILSKKQQKVLLTLGPFLSQTGFYLGGGTAVALHVGHRRSIDLDWFTRQPLKDPLGLASNLADLTPFTIDETERGTLHGRSFGVRISLLEYRYPLLRKLKPFPAYRCLIAAREDLACMKLAAVSQRGSKKDFIDLRVLMEKIPLKTMLKWFQIKYPVANLAPVFYGLTYFDDADREPLPNMIRQINWKEVKQTIRQKVMAAYSSRS